MALTLNPNAQAVFFEKIFGALDPVTVTVKALISGWSVKFSTGFIGLTAEHKGKLSELKVPVNTTSLMKGTAGAIPTVQAKAMIAEWIMGLKKEVGAVTINAPSVKPVPVPVAQQHTLMLTGINPGAYLNVIKAIRTVTGLGLKDAKEIVDKVKDHGIPSVIGTWGPYDALHAFATLQGLGGLVHLTPALTAEVVATLPPVKTVPVAPQLVDHVISLKDAQAIGQKVRGTSAGSVYYCVAVATHVRLAARIQSGGTISIRAEWTGNPVADLDKLKQSGLVMKGNYGSMHMDSSSVPFSNTVGAFLIGCGVDWQQAVISGSHLKIEG